MTTETTVHLIQARHKRSVTAELEELLRAAQAGEIIGLGYTVLTRERGVRAGLSGLLARDRLAATGALFSAALSAAYQDNES
jgi:hypothetical protein